MGKRGRKIVQYKDGVEVQRFDSIRMAANFLKLDNSSISKVAYGIHKQCGGYVFKFEDIHGADGEIWRYHKSGIEVSTFGRVKTSKGKVTTGTKQRIGYYRFKIGEKLTFVHRLVLETFVGDCPEGMECDHKDRDKANNRIENLHWVTHTENQSNRSNTRTYA